MANMIETLLSHLDGKTLADVAGNLGESPGAVKKGLQGGAAAMLGAIADKSHDTGFLNNVVGLVKDPSISNVSLSNVGTLLTGGAASSALSSRFLGLLFGSNQSTISGAISQVSGLKGTSASSLLAMAAPMVMAFLGNQVKSAGLDGAGLGHMLDSQKASLTGFLPAGLGTMLASGSAAATSARGAAMPAAQEASSSAMKWLLPLLVIVAAVVGLFWLLQRGKGDAQSAATEATAVAGKAVDTATNSATAAWAALGELFSRDLPNGVKLNIPKLGVENRLIDFIASDKPVDKDTWFDFDRLLFDTGAATLQPASQEQLKNIAEILKAYPKVHLKIGGYTDNTGDAKANLALSDARAKTVMEQLVALGVGADRLTSQGYGEEHPVAANDTEEGRQKNRRVSARVTAK